MKKETKPTRRPGSGRTKGSYSFVRVPWTVLQNFVGKNSEVTVSRKWAEANGLYFTLCTNAAHIHSLPRIVKQ